jgi:hypothetical protein
LILFLLINSEIYDPLSLTLCPQYSLEANAVVAGRINLPPLNAYW